MLNIGSKKYRNLQEQVGYNTECIEEIKKAIDGLDLDDKLVIIANDTGTFNSDELQTLSLPLAFISDGSKVWMKESETLTELIYKAIDILAEEIGSAYFNIGGTKITINKTTGYYELTDDLLIVSYSKSQLDSIVANINALKADKSELALKADLSGANFTGPIAAPSIIEDMIGYSFVNKTSVKYTKTNVYAGIVKNGNKLTLTYAFKVTITASFESLIDLCEFYIPANVANKLYPTSIGGYNLLEVKQVPFYYYATSAKMVSVQIAKITNGIKLSFYPNALDQGTEFYGRIEVTFLLSDNLVS